MSLQHIDLFRERLEPGEFRNLDVPWPQHDFLPGAVRERAFQPRTPNVKLACDGGQRTIGKHRSWKQIQEIRQREVNRFTTRFFSAATGAVLVLSPLKRFWLRIH